MDMTLHLFLLLIDSLAVVTILLIGVSILKSSPSSTAARIFGLIAFNTACFQIAGRASFSKWIPIPYQFDIGAFALPMQLLMNSTPGLFMYLCFVLFQEETRFPRWLTALFIGQMVLESVVGIFHIKASYPDAWLLFDVLPALLQMTFVGFSLYWTAKDWRVDLIETRRLLRLVFILIIGVMTFGLTLIERVLIAPDSIWAFYVHEGSTALSAVLNTWLILILINTENLHLSRLIAVASPVPPVPDAAVDRDFQEFERAFNGRHLYREAGLSVASLALKLSIPEYRLRRLINEKLGYRNFNAMLNHYRVDEVATELANPAQRNTPILTIALTAGYESINPFNRAFRELKGMTPSEFRQKQFT